MCGILGYTGSNISIIKKAHALQSHRGPDGEGFYNDDYISLGHNRLAIIDVNPRSAQPMWDNTERYYIIFNGEIYNYQELRKEYLQDYVFKTESDTEVIIGLFVKYGVKMQAYLQGMYAFVIYDKIEKKVHLFRDEFGIKPLFYAYGDFGICFASEIKAIITILGETRTSVSLDHDSILTYLTLGHTITPNTIYKEIKLVSPNTQLTFDLSTHAFSLMDISVPEKTQDLQKDFESIVISSIQSNLIADVPVGVFFSGGVDSSLICAVVKEKTVDINTFSLSIVGRGTDDPYIKSISKHLKLNNSIRSFDTKEFEESYTEVLTSLDNPSGANGIFQTYYISKMAAKKVKVVLLGDGGDEIFNGYNRSLFLGKFTTVTKSHAYWFDTLYLKLPSFKSKNWLFHKLSIIFKLPLNYYMNEMSLERDRSDPKAWAVTVDQINSRAIPPSLYDYHLYLQDGLLIKNDIATSLCSIEGRLPLLNKKIQKHVYPYAHMSLTENVTKVWLKNLLSKYVPPSLVFRKKAGFGINYKKIVTESVVIKNEYEVATSFLTQRNINFSFKNYSHYEKTSFQMPIVINSLYRSLLNNERNYGSKIY